MIRVQVRPNETLEAALRRFKRQCNYAGIFRLAKKYNYHEKSSDKKRREDRERVRAIKRAMKKLDGRSRTRPMKKSRMKGGQKEESLDTVTSTPPTGADAAKAKAAAAAAATNAEQTPATAAAVAQALNAAPAAAPSTEQQTATE